ncbi:MAG: Gfo/Idh/MocA family oxidoreductase [Verrucomicrobiae bacterium]|nr:Gfo/Idh/MocA family oxidoreductase [Verrucomicrobiae bacterium]
MSKKLVVGQIGCGAFGTDIHGTLAHKHPNIGKMKWACDVFDRNAQAFAKRFNVEKTTASFTDVTTDPEVDAIFIATTHEARVPIIESAAKHGKHIFCEKPMAMTEWEAYQIVRAVKQSKVKFCVDYMRRMAPAVTALKREWLKHKAHPKHQPWRYTEKPREKLLEEKTTDFLVRVQDESSSYRMVHLDPFHGGGLIIGEAVHWLDLACWLFDNDRPVEIQAWGSARMRYGIYLTFQSGNAATILMTPNGTFDYPKEMYEIAHDAALFRMEFFVENQYYGRPGPEQELFPLARDPLPKVGKEGGLSGFLKKHQTRCNESKNVKTDWGALLADHGYGEMFNGFIEAILHDKPVPCSAMDGYHATYLGELAMKSIELAKPMPVPVDKWDYYVDV